MASKVANNKIIKQKNLCKNYDKEEGYEKTNTITKPNSYTISYKSKASQSQETPQDNDDQEQISNKTSGYFHKNKKEEPLQLKTLRAKLEDKEKKKQLLLKQQNTNKPHPKDSAFLTKMRNYETIAVMKKHDYLLKEKKRKEFDYIPTKSRAHNKSFSVAGSEIEYRIQTFYEWESRRKEKIEKMKDILNTEASYDLTFQPNDNKPIKMNPKKSKALINRLYKDDKKKREMNKKALIQLMTPSFKPQINPSNKRSVIKLGNKKTNHLSLDYISQVNEVLLRNKVTHCRRKKSCQM